MKKSYILYLLIFITKITAAQIQFEEAPEKWTFPQKIRRGSYPTINWEGNKLYFIGNGICYIEKTDTGWSDTVRLSNQVNNQMFLRKPVLSPDEKTLIFSGSEFARLFRSKWNDQLNDWDTASIFNDNGISQGIGYWELSSFLNDTTMILIYWGDGKISHYDSAAGLWSAPVNYPHPSLYIHTDWGSWISPNRKKHYWATGLYDRDLCVSYLDSAGLYTHTYKLNISTISDSLYQLGEFKSKIEQYPFLTPDGGTMYFMANYDTTGGIWSIYESKMYIDENGDTILTNINEPTHQTPSSGFELYPAYPNPFNPLT
ncbi:MAG: hypothetical protein R6W68_10565, partial [Ignavibacteriaceae bacterium]